MNASDKPPTAFVSALRHGWSRGWNSDFNRANRRLQGLLVSFHGYCAAAVFGMSLIGVAAGRNVKSNLVGAAITGAIAIVLIKFGKAIRRSGTQKEG